MKDENKVCLYCDAYNGFYIKRFCHFERQKTGYCHLNKIIVADNRQTCEAWRKNHTLRKIRKEVALKSLITVLEDFATIKQILIEESEENKINRIK